MFRTGAAGKRRDASEAAIVQALERVGVRVWYCSGRGLPDLICWHRGRAVVAEVKTSKGRLRATQRDVPWPIWRTAEDAMKTLFGKDR